MKMTPENENHKKGLSRRDFMKGSALAAAGFMIVPRHVLGKGFIAPSDKLNIAGIGVGGMGRNILRGAYNGGTENIVALCDVDDLRAAQTFADYPNAKRYKDFRVMLEAHKGDVDAVMVATPDHTHAVTAMAAMQLGKHVYVEKPLTHNVWEARMMTETARKYKLVTQMGNHGSSTEDIRRVCEWIWSGAIGEVREVHTWTNRPIWPQSKPAPRTTPAVPATLDWNLFLGPAQFRPYHPDYLPFKWRGWYAFGTGALGDMACHILDPVFRALKLGYPSSVEATVSDFYVDDFRQGETSDCFPQASIVWYEFPEREGMPPVKLHWYDGGLRPPRPEELGPNEEMGDWSGGVIFIGSKGKLMTGCYAANPTLLPTSRMKDFQEPAKTLPRVQGNHQTSWVAACKGKGPAPSSNFDYAGPFSEMVLMGNLAIRSQYTQEEFPNPDPSKPNIKRFTGRKKLLWDGANMRITNYDLANQFVKPEYRQGWSLGV